MPKAKSTPLMQCINNFPSSPSNTAVNSTEIMPIPNNNPLFQILFSLLPPDLPYELTLPFEELLLPKPMKNGKIPRPQNPWMLFRKDFTAKIKIFSKINKLRVQDISSLASNSWKQQPPQVKQFFDILHISAKEIHNVIYPDYKFRPERKFKLRFDKIKNGIAPQIDDPLPSSQYPLIPSSENFNLLYSPQYSDSSSSEGISPSLYEPSSEDIYSLLQDCNNNNCTTINESNGVGLSMKEFFDLTVLELNNTQ
ncbi:hypothetical protein C1645_730726 [Glomus cerebriforme]|uniref:HMG box domain-containing protein n=1 Tax=Glomus cerebriforme TaxID=658196 RepID=A0A397TRV0_9GLOM|nr:hypothetical protein C1645_730726 [Glomus cerebriforme]